VPCSAQLCPPTLFPSCCHDCHVGPSLANGAQLCQQFPNRKSLSPKPSAPQPHPVARPARAGRWRSPPAVAPEGGGVLPPSPPTVPPSARRHTPTSTEAKRSRVRSQSCRRRHCRQIPPATPPHATHGSCPPPSLSARPRNASRRHSPSSTPPLADRLSAPGEVWSSPAVDLVASPRGGRGRRIGSVWISPPSL
jgi:hypothetical protein